MVVVAVGLGWELVGLGEVGGGDALVRGEVCEVGELGPSGGTLDPDAVGHGGVLTCRAGSVVGSPPWVGTGSGGAVAMGCLLAVMLVVRVGAWETASAVEVMVVDSPATVGNGSTAVVAGAAAAAAAGLSPAEVSTPDRASAAPMTAAAAADARSSPRRPPASCDPTGSRSGAAVPVTSGSPRSGAGAVSTASASTSSTSTLAGGRSLTNSGTAFVVPAIGRSLRRTSTNDGRSAGARSSNAPNSGSSGPANSNGRRRPSTTAASTA